MDNTIFDSRKLYEQREKRTTANVAVTGNVPAGTLRTYVSEWFNMSIVNSTIRGDIFVPGSLQIPSGSNLTMTVPAFVTYNANFDAFVPYIEIQGGLYRAVVLINNPYNTAIPSLERTVTFTLKEFVPPSF